MSLPRLHVSIGRHRRSSGIGRVLRAAAATLAVSVVVIGATTTPVHAEARGRLRTAGAPFAGHAESGRIPL